MKKQFSKNYASYDEWLVDNPCYTTYKKRIIRLHNQYPDASLSQLRGHAKKTEKQLSNSTKTPISGWSWFSLNPQEKLQREKSLKVVSDVRRNRKSLSQACKDQGVSPKTVLKSTNAFKKQGNRWIVKSYDKIPRLLKINENGKVVSIEVNDSRIASQIGRYHNAVKIYLETGNTSELSKFKGKTIRDSTGHIHSLEVNPDALDRIHESIEEPEFYDIYSY